MLVLDSSAWSSGAGDDSSKEGEPMSCWAEVSGRLRARLCAAGVFQTVSTAVLEAAGACAWIIASPKIKHRVPKFPECAGFNLPYSLARSAKRIANFLKRVLTVKEIAKQQNYVLSGFEPCSPTPEFKPALKISGICCGQHISAHCQFRIARSFNGGLPLIPIEALA
jgi:hypothetical protein